VRISPSKESSGLLLLLQWEAGRVFSFGGSRDEDMLFWLE